MEHHRVEAPCCCATQESVIPSALLPKRLCQALQIGSHGQSCARDQQGTLTECSAAGYGTRQPRQKVWHAQDHRRASPGCCPGESALSAMAAQHAPATQSQGTPTMLALPRHHDVGMMRVLAANGGPRRRAACVSGVCSYLLHICRLSVIHICMLLFKEPFHGLLCVNTCLGSRLLPV